MILPLTFLLGVMLYVRPEMARTVILGSVDLPGLASVVIMAVWSLGSAFLLVYLAMLASAAKDRWITTATTTTDIK